MQIEPTNLSQNEAWLFFRLNEAPVQTELDGDLNAMTIMDVATGLILGMELVSTTELEISLVQSRKLLLASENMTGSMPLKLFVSVDDSAEQLIEAANELGVIVKKVPATALAPIIQEAKESFSAHLSDERFH